MKTYLICQKLLLKNVVKTCLQDPDLDTVKNVRIQPDPDLQHYFLWRCFTDI